jgi:hypothetical protein
MLTADEGKHPEPRTHSVKSLLAYPIFCRRMVSVHIPTESP